MVPDFYARLGVDQGASAAEIEVALKKQQPIWSMGTRNPKTRHTNQLYLDEVPALRRALLSGANPRAAYDAELAAALVAEREAKLDLLQRRIRLRAAKGGLSPADRALLRDEAARFGLAEEIVDRLTRLIPDLASPVRGVESIDEDLERPADVLDPSTRRQIRAALRHLGRRDLYDALDLPREAPPSIIAARADEQRQRWMRKAQVTAEKTAWLEVISHAQSHLTATRARARYDQTLRLEAEETFEEIAAFAFQGLTRLDLGTRSALIDEAASLGIAAGQADRLLTRACRKHGVAHDPSALQPVPPAAAGSMAGVQPLGNGAYAQVRCRNCSGLMELSPIARRAGTARCRHCGASLKWDCPVCRRAHWVDEPKCECGFPLALREPLVQHFSAAQHAFRGHDLNAAREHLEQVQKYAPQHVGARNGLARIRQHEVEIEQARMACELALAGKRLVAAKHAVEAWRKLDNQALPEIHRFWKEVGLGLRQAEELSARARKLERVDPAAARGLYRRSLDLAADLPEAMAGLNRCPPDSPTGLNVQVLGDRVRLSWTPPPPDGCGPLTFAILRRRGAIPQHPADGTRIAEVSMCEFDDRHVKPGETVSYAVLGKRGEAESLAAVAGGPVLYLPDVEDVRVDLRQTEVELSWIPPRGVDEVRVVRKLAAPPDGPRDGDRVPAALDHAIDANVREGQIVHYGIYAIYRSTDGRRFPSPGVIVAASPQPLVPPLAPPRLTLLADRKVRLDWVEPSRGSVRILRTRKPLPFAAGSRIRAEEAEPLGDWIDLTGSDRAEDLDPPDSSISYYTALVSLGRALTVGESAALSRVADPSDLRASRTGLAVADPRAASRVTLRWNWPAAATATEIVARQGSPPGGPNDPAVIAARVTREEYDRHGAWVLTLPASGSETAADLKAQPVSSDATSASDMIPDRWYIRAFAIVESDGESICSPGLEPSATTAVSGPHPEVSVTYSLKRPWIPGLPWWVTLRTEPPGAMVPPLVLVANERALPLSAEDGEIVARIPGSRDGANHPIRTSFPLARSGVRAFVDPAADPGAVPPIRLRHPEPDSARA